MRFSGLGEEGTEGTEPGASRLRRRKKGIKTLSLAYEI
jgi:hypothetical protein